MANKIQKGIKKKERKALKMVLFCWFHTVHNGTLCTACGLQSWAYSKGKIVNVKWVYVL